MRRGRTLIFVFLIIVIMGVVGFVVYTQYIAKPAVVEQPPFTEVYIAAQPIPQGGTITADLLTTIKIAPENVVEVMYAITEQGDLVGKTAKFQLDQGVVITSSMVGAASSSVTIPGPLWASLIPTGMTAISIPTNRFALSGYSITDGAHVNLNACFFFVDVDPTFQSILPNSTAALTSTGFPAEGGPSIVSLGVAAGGSSQGRLELDPSLQQPYYLLPSEAQRPRMVCQTMLQDVVVMNLGNFSREPGATIDSPPSVTTDANGNQVPNNPVPDLVTLIVTPQDSITLTYLINIQQTADTQTRLSMTLRNPSDLARYSVEAATLQFLLSQYNIPVPAKLPYALEPRLNKLLTTIPDPADPNRSINPTTIMNP